MHAVLKQLPKALCPPAIWQAMRWTRRAVVGQPKPRRPGVRMLSTLDEVDASLDEARRLAGGGFDQFAAFLDSFALNPPRDLPADPFSRAYDDRQMELYAQVSACDEYRAELCEQTQLCAENWERPYPYWTRSSTVVGEQLMAIGFLIRASATKPGHRVLEFGPGYGRLTLEFARMDLDVSAVEINPTFIELIRQHASREGLRVDLHLGGMLEFACPQRYDRVYFYECFHHCADHAAMVARLDSLVAPGGAVVFAGEPIDDYFPMPWGLRLDGRSLWAIRTQRWLELGFRTDYFLELLSRHGWVTKVHTSADVHWQRAFVARRKSDVK